MRAGEVSRAGFTLIEILVVVTIIGLLLAIALPNFMRIRANARTQACIANLGKLEAAKQIWGVEKGKVNGDTPLGSDLAPDYLRVLPECPASGAYDLHPIGEVPTCSVPGHTL
ncbi:MAG: prepilin-type N-terminal cleavage/methylation domain-containing protein [Verrucomicrobia bacterium]|nr:prepilin-type N-terminal cleavage/methylation domain-containing protein [Verrucomicrobiota bacterium]